VQGAIDWSGPTNFNDKPDRKFAKVMPLLTSLLGANPILAPNVARNASPIAYVHKNAPPFLICHGDIDSVVPITQSIELKNALLAAGDDVTMVTVHNGHERAGFYQPPVIDAMQTFINKTLKN
jgi:dipeptidyl aminopeptidase/acylaminoacyl peptidase